MLEVVRKTARRVSQSLIIPVYMNEKNIPDLIPALEHLSASQGPDLEVIFVVDGSPDRSFELLNAALPRLSFPAQIITHRQNLGSFTAIRTGMEHAQGQTLAVMAADLQEPPELLEKFFETLKNDSADVVFGERSGRQDPPLQTLLANTFWSLYRKAVPLDIPKGGVDIFACNRAVRDAVLAGEGPDNTLIPQLFSLGQRRAFVPYQRRKRQKGKSAWSFRKRVRYMMDNIFFYSDLPLQIILWVGVMGLAVSGVLGLAGALAHAMDWVALSETSVWILACAFVASGMLTSQGIIGGYLLRGLKNNKERPPRTLGGVFKNHGYL